MRTAGKHPFLFIATVVVGSVLGLWMTRFERPVEAQGQNFLTLTVVTSAPSGACTNGAAPQLVKSTGIIYTCQSSTWATATGAGGTVSANNTAAGATALYAAAGGSTTVSPSGICTDNGTTLQCSHIDATPIGTATQAIGKFSSLTASNNLNMGSAVLLCSGTAPTISSGFGTSPSIATNNGSCSFTLNVGTGATATTGTIGRPAAAHGWACNVTDITTPGTNLTRQSSAGGTTTVPLTNYNNAGTVTAWPASDILNVNCSAN